jgi:hypothetical protein
MIFFFSLVLALIWGQLSTYFFFRGWVSFLAIIYGIGCLARRRVSMALIFQILVNKITEVVFYGLLLFLGFYLFYFRLGLGRTPAETMVFLVSTSVRLFFVIPRLSAAIDDFMREVDDTRTDSK